MDSPIHMLEALICFGWGTSRGSAHLVEAGKELKTQRYKAKEHDFHTQNLSCPAFPGRMTPQDPPVTIPHCPQLPPEITSKKKKKKKQNYLTQAFVSSSGKKTACYLLSPSYLPYFVHLKFQLIIYFINIHRNQREKPPTALSPSSNQSIFLHFYLSLPMC